MTAIVCLVLGVYVGFIAASGPRQWRPVVRAVRRWRRGPEPLEIRLRVDTFIVTGDADAIQERREAAPWC